MTLQQVNLNHSSQRDRSRARRGNTIVLVAGILVLLVIIATSYLTTTQAQRGTSIAQQAASQRDDNSELIGQMLAEEIAGALFVWPVDIDDPSLYANYNTANDRVGVADSNFPRRPPAPNATRYGIDAEFPYNHAPHHTVPFTNWPDWVPDMPWVNSTTDLPAQANPRRMPEGPGNVFFDTDGQAGDGGAFNFVNGQSDGLFNASVAAALSAEYNPLGQPGFGDTRWLRDVEPVRWDTGQFAQGITPGDLDSFSHWRHLTNIARANNAWRIVWDISDVDNHIMDDLSVPVEQWLAVSPRTPAATNINPLPYRPDTGLVNAVHLLGADPAATDNLFWRQWRAWFNSGLDAFESIRYEDVFANQNFGAPPNYYRLNDLNGDGAIHDYIINEVRQDTPDAEFIPGTARHTVSRVLTDTDGDGFTDSFWFLSPTPLRGGIRQVVGVSITDNSARLNANVATRFQRDDVGELYRKTRGLTPADLALVGQLNASGGNNTFNVGLLDNASNWVFNNNPDINYVAEYNVDRWNHHLSEVGLPFNGNFNANPASHRLNQSDRLSYWQYSGRFPLGRRPSLVAEDWPFQPFSLNDELELRMFEGQNHPWMFSRLEYTVQAENTDGLLRSSRNYAQSSEYLNQNNARDQLRDMRRQLTVYSGARNEHSTPGLWWFNRYRIEPTWIQDLASSPQIGINSDWWRSRVYDNFAAQSRLKLDLREPDFWFYDDNGNYFLSEEAGRLNFRDRLAPMLLSALTDGPDQLIDKVPYDSYFGRYSLLTINDPFGEVVSVNYDASDGPLNRARRMAGAFAANILSYRSNLPVALDDAVLLPEFGYPGKVDVNHPNDDLGSAPINYLAEGSLTTGGASTQIGYLGIDPQPFLVETFIAHVYKSEHRAPWVYISDPEILNTFDCETLYTMCLTSPDAMPVGASCYENAGHNLVFERPQPAADPNADPPAYDNDFIRRRGTIVAVQIANPFDVPIDLADTDSPYRVRAFGFTSSPADPNLSQNVVNLRDVLVGVAYEDRLLYPSHSDMPHTAILFAVPDTIGQTNPDAIRDKWLEFMDIDLAGATQVGPNAWRVDSTNGPLVPGTLLIDVNGGGVQRWSTQHRRNYDESSWGSETATIAIERRDSVVAAGEWVTIDRMDSAGDRDFSEVVAIGTGLYPSDSFRVRKSLYGQQPQWLPRDFEADYPCSRVAIGDADAPVYPADYDLGSPSEGYTHWVQWVRGTRAWGADVNGNGLYEANERNPRYVFGSRAVVVPTSGTTVPSSSFVRRKTVTQDGEGNDVNGESRFRGGVKYRFDDPPADPLAGPWFARSSYNTYGELLNQQTGPNAARRPTFFGLGWREDNPGGPNWSSVSNTHASRIHFMPDKGWYGQYMFKLRNTGGDPVELPDAQDVGVTTVSPDTVADIYLARQYTLPANGAMERPSNYSVDTPPVLFDSQAFPPTFSLTVSGWGADVRVPLFSQPFGMQMSQKNKIFPETHNFPGFSADEIDEITRNRDFEQVGELLNVWLFGHEVLLEATGTYDRTLTTFAEFMSGANGELTGFPRIFHDDLANGVSALDKLADWRLNGEPHRVNRLRLKPVDIDRSSTRTVTLGAVINRPDAPDPADADYVVKLRDYRRDMRHAWAAVPAGARVLDLFVCDGPGRIAAEISNLSNDINGDGDVDELDWELISLFNANRFTGRMTPGLININTATPEVLRALPHMTRVVGEWPTGTVPLAENPYSLVPFAMVRYRDRIGAPIWDAALGLPFDTGPAYAHRGRWQDFYSNPASPDNPTNKLVPGMRGDRGFASLGELGLLTQSGRFDKDWDPSGEPDEFTFIANPNSPLNGPAAFFAIDRNSSWRIDYATMPDREAYRLDFPTQFLPDATDHPYASFFRVPPAANTVPSGVTTTPDYIPLSNRISTDTVDDFIGDSTIVTAGYPAGFHPDITAEDTHEANLLLAGISNLVTTRSDTFTVHFRVRSFRQNPVTGVWDATDPEYIVDDTRYVMLVDRSNVNSPSDKPRILYLEKLPK